MKRLLLLCAVIGLCHFDVFCQKKYEMVIEKTNGEEVVINTEDIVRTYFRERSGGNTPDSHVEGLTAVDLGLPSGTKWANINVGAGDAKPFGGYYSWGEINEKTSYYWKDYLYGSSMDDVVNIGTDISGTEFDVAHKLLGGSWVMPTLADMRELLENCTFQWTVQENQKGGLFTSKRNGNSVFFPAGGLWWNGSLHETNKSGNYWSSTLDSEVPGWAVTLYFDEDGPEITDPAPRCDGNSIRPVCH